MELIYPLTPNKISSLAVQFNTKKVEFEESSYTQRMSTRRTPRKIFQLEHTMLDNAKERLLLDFFETCKGAMRQFDFNNHIDNTVYKCYFKEDTLNIQRINSRYANITLELESC